MASFAEKTYKRLRRQVLDKGAEIVFNSYISSNVAPSETWDETAEDPPVSEGSSFLLSGMAVELPGNSEEYAALALTAQEAVTLLYVPDQIGFIPGLSATAIWAGELRTVREIFPIRPDGNAVGARVIMV